MKKIYLFNLFICFISFFTFGQKFFNPTISPDGKYICFVYENNLWYVSSDGGDAYPLTINPANDNNPVWSPDSKKIVFSSDRTGKNELYILDFPHGDIKQITSFGATNNLAPTSWINDKLLFNFFISEKEHIFVKNMNNYQQREIANTFDKGYSGVFSPDGKYIAYLRTYGDINRRNYFGSANIDIWIKKTEDKYAQKRLTDYKGNDFNPVWSNDGKEIYYITDRDGKKNIWVQKIDGKSLPKQLTFHKNNDVFFFSKSLNSNKIYYELDGHIWVYDIDSQQSCELKINLIGGDFQYENKLIVDADENVNSFSFFPDNSYVLNCFNDIFYNKNKKRSETRELKLEKVIDDIYPESYVLASPDTENIIYISTKDGYKNIYMKNVKTKKTTQITSTKNYIEIYNWDLEGKYFLYNINNKIYKYDKITKNSQFLFEDNTCMAMIPLSKKWWLLSIQKDFNNIFEYKLYNIEKNESYFITASYYWKSFIGITDKKELIFVDNGKINLLPLEKDENKLDLEETENADEDTTKDKQIKKNIIEEINVNFDFIKNRSREIVNIENYIDGGFLYPDNENIGYYFYSNKKNEYEVRKYNLKTSKDEFLFSIGNIQQIGLDKKGEKILLISNNELYEFNNEKVLEKISFKNEIIYDKNKINIEIFRQAWLELKHAFYDSTMHGIDWDKMYQKYLPYISKVRTKEEMNIIMNRFLGELKASHLDFYKFDYDYYTQYVFTSGMLGLEFDYSYLGDGYKVKDIILNGQFDKKGIDLKKGDYIIAINDTILTKDKSIFTELIRKGAKVVKVTYNDKPDTSGAKNVYVKISNWWDTDYLIYYNKIIKTKKLVAEKSNNKIAYFHIRYMNYDSYNRFIKEFYSESYGKEGIIIDIRGNGGGWLHEELFDILNRKAFCLAKPRNIGKEIIQPSLAYTGKIVLLINENCYSDAEIFPYIFKLHKLGIIIGVPTSGSVIGTNDIDLFDGSYFRLPRVGWYTIDRKNLENSGVEPDIYVENKPEDIANDFDRQLDEAIKYLLK